MVDLDRLAAVAGKFERLNGGVNADGVGDQGAYVEPPGAHHFDRGEKFAMKTERTFELNFLGGHGLHGQGHVSAQPQLHNC